jgi:hypothetical protein
MNINNFLLTPDEATNLINDLGTPKIPQQLACSAAGVFCVGVAAAFLYVAVVYNWAVVANIAVAAMVFCYVIGPCPGGSK